MNEAQSQHPGKGANTAAINVWFEKTLADPAKAQGLKTDWRKLLSEELPLSDAQKEHLASLPQEEVQKIDEALTKVLASGGNVRIERESETSPGEMIFEASEQDQKGQEGVESHLRIVIPILKCTFDANCQNWHCHWVLKTILHL